MMMILSFIAKIVQKKFFPQTCNQEKSIISTIAKQFCFALNENVNIVSIRMTQKDKCKNAH